MAPNFSPSAVSGLAGEFGVDVSGFSFVTWPAAVRTSSHHFAASVGVCAWKL
jgi:hypothetical protein